MLTKRVKGFAKQVGRKYLVWVLCLFALEMSETGSGLAVDEVQNSLSTSQVRPEVLADRLSFIMRGVLASDLEKEALAQKKETPASLAEKYKKDPRFEKRLSEYWNRTLKIRSVDLPSLKGIVPFKGQTRTAAEDFDRLRVELWYIPSTGAILPVPAGTAAPTAPLNQPLPISLSGYKRKLHYITTAGKTGYYSIENGNVFLPAFCPGFNPLNSNNNSVSCVRESTAFNPKGALIASCSPYGNPKEFYCEDKDRVEYRPNWKGWATETIEGNVVPKALMVCPGVKKSCTVLLPGDPGYKAERCKPNAYPPASVKKPPLPPNYDTSFLLSTPLLKGACEAVTSRTNEYMTCSGDNLTTTNPWWNPSATVQACKKILDPGVCGPNLKLCSPNDKAISIFDFENTDPSFNLYVDLLNGLTFEPGLIAARTIIDNRSWNGVVTGTESLANGALETFLTLFAPVSADRPTILEMNSPPGTYRQTDGTSKFNPPRLAQDTSNRWFERGKSHAGMLTTIAYMSTFNGTRAKANGAYEGLLCKKFVLPVGTKPQPDSETDLTKKAVCSECHKTLEPMADFFTRWQHKENMFGYSPDFAANGEFRGMPGSDVTAFANALVAQPEFPTCAVARMFEFYAGRPFTANEFDSVLPKLVEKFEASGRTLWSIVPDILSSEAFTGRK